MPRQSLIVAAMFALIAVMASARPALAAYGAYAYDQDAGKYGYSYNEQTEKAADTAALKGCNSGGCKIVFRTGPQQCGAIAATENGKVWGGAHRDRRPEAELAAMQDCQKRTQGQCKVKASECNH
jgi:hypothetical protein